MATTHIPQPELRAELLRRRDAEQQARFAYLDARDRGKEPYWAPVRAIDEDNLTFLIEAIGRHGWIGSDLVGPDGASACWLMVQHAPLQYQDQHVPERREDVGQLLAPPRRHPPGGQVVRGIGQCPGHLQHQHGQSPCALAEIKVWRPASRGDVTAGYRDNGSRGNT